MDALPFEQVNRITHQLTNDMLEQLVAVFSKRQNDDLLLVYLPQHEPSSDLGQVRAISLDDFRHWDISGYDGLIIAFSAIDVVRSDIPTVGPNFFPLDQLLRQRDLAGLSRRSSAELSNYLYNLLKRSSWHSASKLVDQQQALLRVIPFSIPALLEQVPRRDLVGIIPDRNLQTYFREHTCSLIYRDPPPQNTVPATAKIYSLDALEAPGFLSPADRVIALEEIIQQSWKQSWKQSPAEAEPFVTDLRTVLRKGGLNDALNETLGFLAIDFYHRWETGSQNPQHLEIAYSLALERWLAEADVDDLIGVLPCNDFYQFVLEGSAIYIYRQLPEPAPPDNGVCIRYLALHDLAPTAQIPAECGQLAFALLPLRAHLLSLGVKQYYPLGPILNKASKVEALARSAWLLVRTLLEWSPENQKAYHLSPTDLAQTIVHTYALYSLDNPWQQRQGRHSRMLAGVGETLLKVLERTAQTVKGQESLYYQALMIWYQCVQATAEDIEPALRQMVELLRKIERQSRDQSVRNQLLIEQARHLQRVGNALSYMLSGGGQPEIVQDLYSEEVIQNLYSDEFKPIPTNVSQAIRLAANMSIQTEVPSLLFHSAFQKYAHIMERIQRIHTSQIPVDNKLNLLRHETVQLEKAYTVIFALQHEDTVLRLLYERGIEETRGRADRLQGSAQLVLEQLTRSVAQHIPSSLSFNLKNVGRVEAENVEVKLSGSERFRLMEGSSVKPLKNIPPDAELRFDFIIKPVVNDDLLIQLKLSYYDLQENLQIYRRDFPIRVTSLDRGPFQSKPNPYIYGVPLQNHQLFYGRRQELEALVNHLASGSPQDFLLRGARRTGKTSILNMVKAVIEDRGGRGGIRAWFEVSPKANFKLDSLQVVLLDLQSLERPLTPTNFYRGVLHGMAEAGLKSSKIQWLMAQPFIAATQFKRVLSDILRENRGKGLVLLVDEFDIVDLIEDKAFNAHLRFVITQVQPVTWIITSALGLYKEIGDYVSPLFNVFKIIELSRLDRDEAARLVRDPWEKHPSKTRSGAPGLQIMDDAVNTILDETGCQPYFIQFLCSEVVDYVNHQKTNYVLHSTVYEVIEKLIGPTSAASEHFAYLWDHAGGMGKVILLLLLQSVELPTVQELWVELQQRLTKELSISPHRKLLSLYENSLRRLESVEAITFDTQSRLVFGIPLFRRLLSKRSEREDLWAAAIPELRNDLKEKLHGE